MNFPKRDTATTEGCYDLMRRVVSEVTEIVSDEGIGWMIDLIVISMGNTLEEFDKRPIIQSAVRSRKSMEILLRVGLSSIYG